MEGPLDKEMPEWQLIKTAPRDGHWILVWLDAPWNHVDMVRWPQRGELGSDLAWETRDGQYALPDAVVTHWMQLPEPPE